jgi:hypothetical protein
MNGPENREMERYSLEIPAHVELANEQGEERLEYVTQDVCSGGAFFHTDQPMPIGTKLKVDLVVPIDQLKKIESDRVLIKVNGDVVRIGEKGMAVRFKKKFTITPLKH